jgi:DNA (cytosine-5)-methyltransferase 1
MTTVDRTYDRIQKVSPKKSLTVAGLFAGIGGIEVGLHEAGHESLVLVEIDEAARAVLAEHFSGVRIESDIRLLKRLPDADLVAAGFPCQDLSQAGRTAGITGRNSGLVDEVFRLLESMKNEPRWLLLENVPFMLQLDRGEAMRYLASRLEELGYSWAYRVVDTRAFGVPQRRRRVLLLASRTDDPRTVLFSEDAGAGTDPEPSEVACGFYWTEGIRGLGWAVDAVPTLKGGSTIGIPSPPAIWMLDGSIVTPDIRDAERLQGFEAGWTEPALAVSKRGHRWKLVGNAVCAPVARWLGEQLNAPRAYCGDADAPMAPGASWPDAAWGMDGDRHVAAVSTWPTRAARVHLADFLEYEPTPLSARAAAGFLGRAKRSSLKFPDGLLDDVAAHLDGMRGLTLAV